MKHAFERTQLVARPRGEVFAFFADAGNLERITPQALRFTIETPPPIEMRAGAIIDYALRIRGVTVHWRTLIELFEPERCFVDVQTKGPYRAWRHVHEFTDAPGGTMVRDHVEYEMPFGVFGEVACKVFVARELRRIFDFRAQAIDAHFGDPESGLAPKRSIEDR